MEELQSTHRNAYYYKHREEILAKLNKKYREDSEFRETARERAKRRYHENEAYRKATIERARRRYRELKQKEQTAQGN